MDIGEFDRLVIVQQRGPGEDTYGQPLDSWTDVCTAWANIRHPSGSETIRAGGPASLVAASVRLWGYRTDITASMRVLDVTGLALPEQLGDADVYDIKAALPDKSGREWVDLVSELVPRQP